MQSARMARVSDSVKRAAAILARMRPEDLQELRELYRQNAHRQGFLELVRNEAVGFGLSPELTEAALQVLDSLVNRPITLS